MTCLKRHTDAVIALALGIGSFILLAIRYWVPPEKIFDEVYFARAAEEYLRRQYIYENTHPPVTKLLITFSTMLFGGLHGGDNAYGWRFFDVVAGALAVVLLFILARRITRSTLFATYAAVLFGCDGMHFVQSRIATPESFVVCFSLLTLYAFCRYWDVISECAATSPITTRDSLKRGAEIAVALAIGTLAVAIRFPHETLAARIVASIVIAAVLYAPYRLWRTRPAGARWLLLFAFSAALLVASKWYGVMAYGVAALVVMYVSIRAWVKRERSPIPLDLFAASVIASVGVVYALAYIPQFIGLSDSANLPPRAYTLSDVVGLQVTAYLYHAHLVATHPYASVWWQWPLDLRPVAYFANYAKSGSDATAAMIYSLPNPVILWPGLIAVPLIGVLAWKRRDRGYTLVVLAYLLQWLPWKFSPRIAFAYHFYVDIPLIALCNALAAQWVWEELRETNRREAIGIIAGYLAAAVFAFVYFYPILAGVPIPQSAWIARMWLHSWM